MSIQTASVTMLRPPVLQINREADHRIANSLAMISSLVRLRAARGDAYDPKTFLTEVADRIDTVAKLHRLLAASDSDLIELPKHLREICDRLSSSVAGVAPRVSLDLAQRQMVPWKTAMPLGLIVAELFSNSLKYAHPTGLPVKISIACTSNLDGGLTITYEDDGVGFPEDFDRSDRSHMGIGLIRVLTVQLNATSDWSSDSLGIRFTMVVPLDADSA
jgi:two-component sensor histidine kinase